MTAPAVSVIIPVYESGSYTCELVKSLQQQTLEELEFIFVDDCGKDGSMSVVEAAATQDSRIVCLYNKENRGPGYSRNCGIEAARGKYLAFADADDKIPADFYEQLYRAAEQSGALVCKGARCDWFCDERVEKSKLNDRIRSRLATGHSVLSSFLYEHTTALYRRDYVQKCGARNGESRQDEDTVFLAGVLNNLPAEQFCIVDEAVYYYRRHAASGSRNIGTDYLRESHAALLEKLNIQETVPSTKDWEEYMAIQFEERLGGRIRETFGSSQITDSDRLSYLEKVMGTIREYTGHHAGFTPLRFTRLVLEGAPPQILLKAARIQHNCKGFLRSVASRLLKTSWRLFCKEQGYPVQKAYRKEHGE